MCNNILAIRITGSILDKWCTSTDLNHTYDSLDTISEALPDIPSSACLTASNLDK